MPVGGLLALGGRLIAGSGIGKRVIGAGARIGGRLLKKGPGTAIVRTLPKFPSLPGTLGRIGGLGAAGTAIARRGIGRKAAGLIAAGIAFEAGGKIFNSITGKEIKQSRRINPGNTRALKRSVRRINSAAKMYGKVLSATKGKRHSGYLIKPKGGKAKC